VEDECRIHYVSHDVELKENATIRHEEEASLEQKKKCLFLSEKQTAMLASEVWVEA
jgi:hypothetical protein